MGDVQRRLNHQTIQSNGRNNIIMTLLTREQQRDERMRALAATFARANTTLIGHPIKCEVANVANINAPGWSQADTITFNTAKIGDIDTTDDIVKVTGLNWHELAHHWFTPMGNSRLVSHMNMHGLFMYFNMLEDQRIESMMCALYPAFKPYFVMTVMKYIASGEAGDLDSAHALTYGRRYLPDNIRAALRQRYTNQGDLTALEAIIDEYRTLVFPRDNQRGIELVEKYAALLRNLPNQSNQPTDPHGHGGTAATGNVQPGSGSSNESQQEAGSHAVQQGGDEAGDDDQYDDATGNGGKSDDANDSDGDGGQPGDGDGNGEGDSDDQGDAGTSGGSGQGESDSDSDDADGDSAGASSGGGYKAPSAKDVEDMARKIADAAANRPDVQADAKIKESAIKRTSGQVPDLDVDDYREMAAGTDFIGTSNKFRKELQRLVTDADPGWHKGEASGRINVKRYFNGDDLDTVFDRWDEGKLDVNSIEVVLLVDYSFSMASQMQQASESAWAIQRAVQAVGGDVTVMGFSDDACTWYSKQDKAKPNKFRRFGPGGGTDPIAAMNQARMIFHYSKHKHKVLLFLTDGVWDRGTDWHKEVAAFRGAGVLTGQAFMIGSSIQSQLDYMDKRARDQWWWDNSHGVDFSTRCEDPKGLIDLARMMVKRAMKS